MSKTNTKSSPIRDKSFALAVRIVKLYRYLSVEKHEFVMSKQLLRSGTSPGANVREAQNGESGPDFIHKLGIAQKETAETLYWLELLHASEYLSTPEFNSIFKDTEDLLKMIRSAILTKKANIRKL